MYLKIAITHTAVHSNAAVYNIATVYNNATVHNNAAVYDNATVTVKGELKVTKILVKYLSKCLFSETCTVSPR